MDGVADTSADSSAPRWRRRRWFAVIAIALLAIGGATAIIATSGDDGAAGPQPGDSTSNEATSPITAPDTDADADVESTSEVDESREDGPPESVPEAPSSPITLPTVPDPDEPLTPPATAVEHDPVAVDRLPAAPVGEDVPFGGGLVVKIAEAAELEVGARAPGETAGPATALTVEVRNDSAEPIDLALLSVTAESADGTPLVPNFTEPSAPLHGILDPGASTHGTYVFRMETTGSEVLVDISHAGSPNIVVVQL